ncbi:transcription-repair coupling factor [Thiomicrorhabdus heinhorstiae]|uniref:Transcription-repair-coupling factor n=1 Tax=Thiomicrorhabdus heinhorstiae TaxID=2748010 RepID=A0ABS0BV54_9GAMM|nr:transcription-repair coupling factor [Thiomicrorhabdus heinhorstiae]MBF6056933.1 transcription-repair coupling factor [Thiomicrorhabdus heinhorstiae]
MTKTYSLFNPQSIKLKAHRSHWNLNNRAESALLIANFAQQIDGPSVIVTDDSQAADQLQESLNFFLQERLPVLKFPEWETLPYDRFSPHQDIVSERLKTLYRLPECQQAILVIPVSTLLQKVLPQSYLHQYTFLLHSGDRLDLDTFNEKLEASGYQRVSQVMEHGEYAIRGSIIDLYPMGSKLPFRIDLFDDEVESIRSFDPESQRSIDTLESIQLLPAKEYDFTAEGITRFKQNFKSYFGDDAANCQLYKSVSNQETVGGLEYYLPLFHSLTETLFDYLPDNSVFFHFGDMEVLADKVLQDYQERYEIGQYNPDFPILQPQDIILKNTELMTSLKSYHRISLHEQTASPKGIDFDGKVLPDLSVENGNDYPLAKLNAFIDRYNKQGKIIFSAESTGRRESLLALLNKHQCKPETLNNWSEALASDTRYAILVSPLEESICTEEICVISESQILGTTVVQRRRRQRKHQDFDSAISNLIELEIGQPVVHIDNGVGRYKGLQTLEIRGEVKEFLQIEYADEALLYVPVSALHLVSRYSGASAETAPLHKLGSDKWEKAKRKAAEKVHDVAAELLDIYAQRAARPGYGFKTSDEAYHQFSASFPFEETPDQQQAIEAVLHDMRASKPMDRLVCGDVGFGKTEVAMRAAFIAAYDGKQVAILVPTTLLAQQHLENFRNRFSDWPMRIEVLSRFQTAKQQSEILKALKEGKIDIIIGTHKLIQKDVDYQNLGLIIIDEEHRFGVRQKEQLKKMRTEVDVLTMTATPIPRTLNMAMNDLRDLSIIATPPAKRLAVQTFVQEWNDDTVREACLREIRRGGQVYLLFNDIDKIEKMVEHIESLLPEAKVSFAHGQMNEKQLESVMEDFYHRRFNILVCTTIIETGIDIPTANTILINRADKFGLAQLHQLRGRVGRSHHKAYAYMFTGAPSQLTKDAEKRLAAIAKHDTLGAGFMLASHDLEIRGAGELLGDDQSGQIQEVGFGLYSELLDRAVRALKSGKQPELNFSLHEGCEIDLGAPSLIPEDYLPDIQTRLVLYKRLAAAKDSDQLRELEIEMIDRFGLLPQQVKNLLQTTEVKLKVQAIGITKVDAGESMIRFQFSQQPEIDPVKLIQLIQSNPKQYMLKGQTELKFFDTMPDIEERVENIERIVAHIRLDA